MASSVKREPLRRWEHRYLGEERFPEMLSALEIEHFFTLDEQELVQVRERRSPVDAVWPDRLHAFEGKPIRSVTQDTGVLAKLPLIAPAPEGEAADISKLLPALKAALGDEVADVRATDRLVDSAVVLAAGAHGPDLQLQRLLRRQGQTQPGQAAPVLEVNPRHALIRSLAVRCEAGGDVAEAAQMLLDLARVQDGDAPRDPARFARQVTEALAAVALATVAAA